jgi:hypothetical protein
MTSISLARLCEKPITFFRPDGSLMDLAAPDPHEVDFHEVAYGLAKLARFTGTYQGAAYSVAQHSVMGCEALLREGEDELTCALFLLHDGHEYKLGDDARPKQDLIFCMLEATSPAAAEAYRAAVQRAKTGWDFAIYDAAGLPTPDRWTNKQKRVIHQMDMRMMAAEAEALMGSQTRKTYPRTKFQPPMFMRGSLQSIWPAALAEERFIETFDRFIGKERRLTAANHHMIHKQCGAA